jgi:hypothetical protein
MVTANAKTPAQAAQPLLKQLEQVLSIEGFARSGKVFRRTFEPGVTHVIELTSAKKVSGLAVGVSFREVLDVALAAGPDWYLFVGDNKFDSPPTIGMCQLVADIGQLGPAARPCNGRWISCLISR